MNPWAASKDRRLKRLLVPLASQALCELEPDAGTDPAFVTLFHPELPRLRAHVFLHGQPEDTYGLFLEFPHPIPGIPESRDALPLPRLLELLQVHFDMPPDEDGLH